MRTNLYRDGFVLFEKFIDKPLIDRMLDDLKNAHLLCQKIRIKNGIGNSEGTLHHLLGHGKSFMDCLCEFEKFDSYLQAYFGGKYILNSFGGNILRGESYANCIHRDQRSFSGDFNIMLNTIIMLDDFTEDNGATWLMERGHEWPLKPQEEAFSDRAFQITAPAGSIVMFNSNLWHRAGVNKTDKPRRSVTPMFSRPFIKPQFDYPRALGYHMGDGYSEYLRQIIGYNSRIPSDLSQWYQTDRYYRSDQG